MSFKDDTMKEVLDMKKEVEEVKEQSIAMELLKDQKKQNKRLFIIWIITFLAFIGLLVYTIYLLNDIETETTTESYDIQQEVDDANTINGNVINRGK